MNMKAVFASLLVATLLWGCGGGGGNPGTCLGSPQVCGEDGGSTPDDPPPPVTEIFSTAGSGDTTFTLPTAVTRLRIQANHAGAAQNFVVRIAGTVVVNELVGTSVDPASFDGTYLVPAGASVEISNSSGVNWVLTQVLPEAPTRSRTGTGDTVFDLASSVRRVRIQASFPGTTQNFVVRIAGRVVVNTLVGTSEVPPAFDAVVDIAGGGTVEIIGAIGVDWSVQEQP